MYKYICFSGDNAARCFSVIPHKPSVRCI